MRQRNPLSTTVTHVLLRVFVVLAIGPILVVFWNSFKTTPGIFESLATLGKERSLARIEGALGRLSAKSQ